MVNNEFIWCSNCDAVHHVTFSDRAPQYVYVDSEIDEIPADEWRAFRVKTRVTG
jgi:hypothetical protein